MTDPYAWGMIAAHVSQFTPDAPLFAGLTERKALEVHIQAWRLLMTTELPEAAGDFLWRPELAPEGPLALLVSIADRRCHAYRNGIEIGQAAVSFARPEEPLLPAVYVVSTRPGPTTPAEWLEVGLFDAARAPRSDALDRLVLPGDFARALDPLLAPGTSLYCALGSATTDSRTDPGFIILSARPSA